MGHARRRCLALAIGIVAALGPLAAPAAAHRDGCHRWHSCPSDTGSYVCGDLGYDTYCGGGGAGNEEFTPTPAEIDYVAPDAPSTGSVTVRAGGATSVVVTAERGSTIRVALDGRVLTSTRATGAAQGVAFRAADGTHVYAVTATDGAGNESYAADLEVTADTAAPAVRALRPLPPGAAGGHTDVELAGEAGARYALRFRSRTGELRAFSRDGALDSFGDARERVLLPNGTYAVTVQLRDDAGNLSRVTTTPLRVSIPKPSLRVTLQSAPNDGAVTLALAGPALGHGTATFTAPGQAPVTAAFDLGEAGSGSLTAALPDGTWRADAVVDDFQKRRASARLSDVRIDTVQPAIVAALDGEAAEHGAIALSVTVEDGATAVVSGLPGDPVSLTGPGTFPVRVAAKDGRYRLVVASTDLAGNRADRELTVRVSHPMSPAEVASGLAGLALLGLGGYALWRHRARVAGGYWVLRAAAHRATLRAAHRRAVAGHAAATDAYRHAERAFETAHVTWDTTAVLLRRNAAEAASFDGGEVPPELRAKPGERAFAYVEHGALVENRRPSGYDVPTVVERGSVLVTDRRVVFTGAKRREWLYDQLVDVQRLGDDGTMMRVTNRQHPSGVMFGTDTRAAFRLELALAAARGQRARFAEGHRAAVAAHLAREPHRPVPPPPVPAAPIAPTAAELRAAHAARRAAPAPGWTGS